MTMQPQNSKPAEPARQDREPRRERSGIGIPAVVAAVEAGTRKSRQMNAEANRADDIVSRKLAQMGSED
jgi:hypothetical protein